MPDSAKGTNVPLNQALSGQNYVHVNDLSGVSSNIVNQSSGTSALLNSSSPSSISADTHFRAEYKLLTDFLVSVPKVSYKPLPSVLTNIASVLFRSNKRK